MMQRAGSSGPSTASRNSREQEETQATSNSVSRDEQVGTKPPDPSAVEQVAPPATVENSVAYQYAAVQQMMTNRDHM